MSTINQQVRGKVSVAGGLHSSSAFLYNTRSDGDSLLCIAYGYTSNEVECNRNTGRCTCRDGYKQDSHSCRRRMLVHVIQLQCDSN